jgi:hypothetical protein
VGENEFSVVGRQEGCHFCIVISLCACKAYKLIRVSYTTIFVHTGWMWEIFGRKSSRIPWQMKDHSSNSLCYGYLIVQRDGGRL